MASNPNNFDPRSLTTNEETKFCTLPGQEPIVLSTVHGGHGCRITDIARTIPLFFHQEAISKGAYTENQIEELTARLAASAAPVGGSEDKAAGNAAASSANSQQPAPAAPSADTTPPAPPAPPAADAERLEKIKAAVIELINAGNPNDFTSSGSPKVEALKDKLGFEVTGVERDAAYEAAKG